MSNNVTKTDPSTGDEAVPVYNHAQNIENAVSYLSSLPLCRIQPMSPSELITRPSLA